MPYLIFSAASEQRLSKVAYILLALGILLNIVNTCRNHHRSLGELGPNGNLYVDAESYVHLGEQMVRDGNVLMTPNIRFSVGMQIITALSFRVFGLGKVMSFHYLNLLAWFVLLALTYFISRALFGESAWPLVTCFLVSSLSSLQVYASVIGYEILSATLILLIIVIELFFHSKLARAVNGILCFVLSVFRVHFALLFVFVAMYRYFSEPKATKKVPRWFVLSLFLP